MTFAPTREIQTTRPSLLESGFDFGFESWSNARPGGLLSALPVGAQQIIGSILRNPAPPRAIVPPVVISEQPSTILPGSSPRGQISKEVDVPEGFYECVIQGVQRLCQEKPPEGWTALPPVPKEFGDIIRAPVPVPVDDKESDMAIDWGAAASGVIDILQGQKIGGGQSLAQPMYQDPMEFWGQSGVPSTVTVNTRTGAVTKCKRRRRRVMLTEGDFNALLRISTLPNNQNVRIALAKAVGRRS